MFNKISNLFRAETNPNSPVKNEASIKNVFRARTYTILDEKQNPLGKVKVYNDFFHFGERVKVPTLEGKNIYIKKADFDVALGKYQVTKLDHFDNLPSVKELKSNKTLTPQQSQLIGSFIQTASDRYVKADESERRSIEIQVGFVHKFLQNPGLIESKLFLGNAKLEGNETNWVSAREALKKYLPGESSASIDSFKDIHPQNLEP
jgi:hypothetical protein